MAYDKTLADRIRALLPIEGDFSERTMFGGVGFLLNGNMCVGVWKEELILRLSPEQSDEALLDPTVRPFDITGRPMTGWVLVGPDGTESDEALRAWIDRSVEYVSLLPAK